MTGQESTVSSLIEQLGHEDYHSRHSARMALTSAGPAAIPVLREAYRSGGNDLRWEVVKTAEGIHSPDSDVLLAEALRDSSRSVRVTAAEGLATRGERALRLTLQALRSHGDEVVTRESGRYVLDQMSANGVHREELRQVLAAMKKLSAEVETPVAADEALQKIGPA